MRLVTRWEEIEKNLWTLKKYRDSAGGDKFEYIRLIKAGICFVVYEQSGELLFGPSRFVGYADNDLDSHGNNRYKHGGETNTAITQVLGYPPREYPALEQEYKNHCWSLGERPPITGRFGYSRLYWFKGGENGSATIP